MSVKSLIGFGEAGQAFASGAGWRAYDIMTEGADAAAKQADYARCGVQGCATLAEAVAGATVVLSVVTADQALAVAEAAAKHFAPGALFCDMNSVAPQTKQLAAAAIEAAGGRYVDVAVMSPVNPARLAVPLLVSGPHAAAGLAALAELGFTKAKGAGNTVGRASTIKMLRSVMYKGLEALTAECLIAAERAGLRDEVLDMLEADWSGKANYRLNRMMVHGSRRAAEMEEAAKTLEGLSVEPLMTRGTVARQREIGDCGIAEPPATLAEMLERIAK
jgi:3-hydroxyisobutyrate dehydrogenase-like beta-hydroxyacid dehydrogenase